MDEELKRDLGYAIGHGTYMDEAAREKTFNGLVASINDRLYQTRMDERMVWMTALDNEGLLNATGKVALKALKNQPNRYSSPVTKGVIGVIGDNSPNPIPLEYIKPEDRLQPPNMVLPPTAHYITDNHGVKYELKEYTTEEEGADGYNETVKHGYVLVPVEDNNG